ncbi:SPOSA6832_02194 [Sporobolomyces salmonicolor]|uniref:SPOSA6832_02194-mRNA-1:cds n=1 Tax=Sporidiobolus salmonicolor TaxID=5005 RepID=A0A0D6EKL4_SPOSA|nr:SPOSA6832_02194 [Sporobolomyces salmonicolor]
MSTPAPPPQELDEKRDSLAVGDEEQGGIRRTDSELEKDGGNLLLQVADADALGLKTASDGKTILVPQPSDDPRDPLNWSPFKKHMMLVILALAAFGGDFQSGAGIPLLQPQGVEWGLTPTHVNQAGNLNVLFLGIGGFIWIPPLYFWGRLPVLFWTQFIGTFLVLGSALVQNFTGYYALRPLTSLFLTAGQTIGNPLSLTFLHDMFFFHEHARKVGIWVVIFLSAPLLIVVFADETWYDRTLAVQPERPSGISGRFFNLTGVTAFRERKYKAKVFPSIMRLVEVYTKPTVIIVFFVYALSFMWAVGINVTSSIIFAVPKEAGGYGYDLRTISFLYFTPLVALILGEIFGHFVNDAVANWYIRRHNGLFKPECRLYIYFVAAFLMIPGLNIVGQGLQHQLNVASIIIGWGCYGMYLS